MSIGTGRPMRLKGDELENKRPPTRGGLLSLRQSDVFDKTDNFSYDCQNLILICAKVAILFYYATYPVFLW